MKKILAFLVIFGTVGWRSSSGSNDLLLSYCFQFRELYENIATGSVTPDSASRAFSATMQSIRHIAFHQDSCYQDSLRLVFPLRGYTPVESIGGKGRGYRPEGFDLFDRNVKGSHPAHDLFIRDKNHDLRDDRTGKPVDILAFSAGIVLDIESQWVPASGRRGGNYIWIYDPCLNGLFYYAHIGKITVKPGNRINRGDKIGEAGRTGLNATRRRSDTHLHFMFLRLDNQNLPVPENTYDWLMTARVAGK